MGFSDLHSSNITDVFHMFEECPKLPDISNFDTRNILDMNDLFE